MAERDQAGVAEDEIEARRRDRIDDDPARQAEVEVEAEGAQQERQRDGERDRAEGQQRGEPAGCFASLSMTARGSLSS